MTVLDPMIFRTADLFFQGANGPEVNDENRGQVWEAISKNIGALFTFIDSIMLHERLPIFNYNPSFHEQQLIDLCAPADVLVSVFVGGEVYTRSKTSALAQLREHPGVPPQRADDILDELAAFRYEWQPAIEGFDEVDEPEYRLKAFLLGGVLFSGFAQQLSVPHGPPELQGEHVLQPKRSELYVSAVLGIPRTQSREAQVFQSFKELFNRAEGGPLRTVEMPATPTFLPLLLQERKPKTPMELFEYALEWRDKGAVKDYRRWRANLISHLHNGTKPPALDAELKEVETAITGTLGKTDVRVILTAGVIPGIQVPLREIWGWVQPLLPGCRHRKLLFQLTKASLDAFAPDDKLKQLWYNARP